MNILILIAMTVGGVCGLWSVQSIALLLAKEPLAWPLRYTTQNKRVKWATRIAIHSIWLSLIFFYPLAVGSTPWEYFGRAFPTPEWSNIGTVAAIAAFLFCAVLAYQLRRNWLKFEPQLDQRTRRSKLLRRFLSPIPLALLEESVFRGIVLHQIVLALPENVYSVGFAIVLSSAIFSAFHFLRPHPLVTQPALGLFVVGCTVGTAYVASGYALWLPITIHAVGIFYTEVVKLYVSYRGPIWYTGTSIFPHCGLLGMTALTILAFVVMAFYSTPGVWYV